MRALLFASLAGFTLALPLATIAACTAEETIAPLDAGPARDAGKPDDAGDGGDGGPPCDAGAHPTCAPPPCGPTPKLLVASSAYLPGPDAAPYGFIDPFLAASGADLWFAVDELDLATNVYTGTVYREPFAGGAPLVATHGPSPLGLVATPRAILFASGNELYAAPFDGGAAIVLATGKGTIGTPVSDGTNAYFADDVATKRVPLAGGPVTSVVGAPRVIAPASNGLLTYDAATKTIARVSYEGGAETPVAHVTDTLYALVGCGDRACWLESPSLFGGDGGALLHAAKLYRAAAGEAPKLLAESTALAAAHHVVFDGASFFVATGVGGGGFVSRVPAQGGDPIAVAALGGGGDIAVDATCLFWSDLDGLHTVEKTFTP